MNKRESEKKIMISHPESNIRNEKRAIDLTKRRNHTSPKTEDYVKDQIKHRPIRKKRKKYRKAKIFIFYTMVIFLLISAVITLSLTILFKIENIGVEGASRYDRADIINTSNIKVGSNLFLCNEKAVANALEQKYPYIESVKLQRKIPNTINIVVSESKPAGFIEDDGRFIIINDKGKVVDILSDISEIKEGTTKITGLKVADTELAKEISFSDNAASQAVLSLVSNLRTLNINNITKLDVSDITDISVLYDDRILIKLGSGENIDKKLTTAMSIINSPEASGSRKGTLDVSISPETNRTYFQPGYSIASK